MSSQDKIFAPFTVTITTPGEVQPQTKFVQACWLVTGADHETCHPDELELVVE